VLAAAVSNGERLRFAYRAVDGAETRRLVEPHRLVSAGRRWYLVAFDNERDDWRIFRVDRLSRPFPTGVRVPARELPAADAAVYVRERLSSTWERERPEYAALVTMHAPRAEVARKLGRTVVDLEELEGGGCRVRTRAEPLEWLAMRLTAMGCEFEVHGPPELAQYLRELAARALRAAG
jgi:predicted DNA-binding transcriptional regulator YafY